MIALWTLVLFWLAGTFLMWRIPTIGGRRRPDGELWPAVSVIIPARDEEARLTPLLRSLGQQSHAPSELIVVDDQSADGTASLAQQWGAQVIAGREIPPGWHGKNWACWQGAQQAHGELFLFLDADTWLERDGLRNIVAAYLERGGLVTAQPYHVTERAYEQLSAFFNIVLMAGINAFTPLGERLTPSGAFGPCLICSREDYFRWGGHAAVKGEVLEDVALAKLVARRGGRVSCYGGRGSISFRMYPGGLRQLVEGWSKGFASGAMALRLPFLALTVAWITGCFGAFFEPVHALRTALDRPLWPFLLAYLLYALQVGWMLRRIGRFQRWTAPLFPIPLIFFGLVMLRSLLLKFVVRRVTWKGRAIGRPIRTRREL